MRLAYQARSARRVGNAATRLCRGPATLQGLSAGIGGAGFFFRFLMFVTVEAGDARAGYEMLVREVGTPCRAAPLWAPRRGTSSCEFGVGTLVAGADPRRDASTGAPTPAGKKRREEKVATL